MKKKSIIAILLTLVMCFSLSACGGGGSFNKLAEYVIDNCHSKNDSGTIYDYYFETPETSDLGTFSISAITEDGTADTCTKLVITGTVGVTDKSYVNPEPFNRITILSISNESDTFDMKYYPNINGTGIVDWYFVAQGDSDTFSRGDELSVDEYDLFTRELKTEDYNSFLPDTVFSDNLSILLDRLELYLAEIGFSIKDLGFNSFTTDSAIVEELEADASEIWRGYNISNSIPQIGMTAEEVENSVWGKPDKKNIDEYEWGIEEQWVYDDHGYVYFENGVVTAIQHR